MGLKVKGLTNNNMIIFDQFCDDKSAFSKNCQKQLDYRALKQPFRMICSGMTGAGKTTAVMNLALQIQYFDDYYFICKSKQEPKLRMIEELLNTNKKGEPIEPIFHLLTCKEFMNYDEGPFNMDILDPNKQHLFIFDDALSYPKDCQKEIEDIFIRSRKYGASAIYITHRYESVPKVCRQNISAAMIFRPPSKREFNTIANELSIVLEPEIIKKLLREATLDPYDFMIVDTIVRADEIPKHIRKGFNNFLALNI